LAADQSGEVICAGTSDSFEVSISQKLGGFWLYQYLFLYFLPFMFNDMCNRFLFGQWELAVC
jgi:hypothetical protein